MKAKLINGTLAMALGAINGSQAQSPTGSPIPVTADNFVRAESDRYFGVVEKEAALASSIIVARSCQSTSRRSCAPISIRSIRRRYSTSMRGR
jgi:hypothetical protein